MAAGEKPRTAAILSTGTELVRGEIVNTNASWLAGQLTREGVEVVTVETVGDDRERIVASIRRLAREHDAIVATGGLGPTSDDITSACVADAIGVPLSRDAASLAAIEARIARFGRTMSPSNARQADFPAGSTVMPNPVGTAPGFAARSGQSTIFCMPGVPHEMKQMFDDHVVPALRALFPDLNAKRSHVSKLRVFGLPESVVGEKLAGLEEAHRVVIGYRAHFPEIEVKFIARDADASLRIARAAAEAKERLGREAVYGEGDTTIGEVIGGMLRERRMTLAVAESATGGLVSHLVTATPASDYFLGGVTTYAESAKTELLGVPPDLLARCGAVSEEVTRAMAEGVRRRLGADVGAAVTGIAGPAGSPSGPDAAKPVGLIHCAVATPSGTIARERVYPMSREFIQKLAAFMTLATVRSALLDR